MKRLLLALTLYSAGQAFAQGAGAPPPVPAELPKTPTTFIANGEEVEIPNLGFSLTPPTGWEVIRNGSGASLLFQAPKPNEKPGVVTYQANIRVMAFDDPRPMDDSTKDEFNKIILDKYSVISSRVSNYLIRSAEKVQLSNGTNAYLYYAEFMFDTTPTMQMHILVSNAHHHFLMTYTDMASVFEAQDSPGLAIAYTSMQSVKLDSVPPERFTKYYYFGGALLALFFLMITVRIVRVQKMKRLGERIESEDGGDNTSYGDSYTGVSQISEMAVRAKPKKRSRDEYEEDVQEDNYSHDDNHDHDDDEMPETRERTAPSTRTSERPRAPSAPAPMPAPKPAPRAPSAPAPSPAPAPRAAPVAAKPKASPAPAPAPAPRPMPSNSPAPKPANFEARTRKTAVSIDDVPPPEVSAVSSAWDLGDIQPANTKQSYSQDRDDDDEGHEQDEADDVAEVYNEPAVTSAAKSRHQSSKPRAKEPEMDLDQSNVALLSDILPNSGEPKKKKGLFGWGKGKKKEKDDDDDYGSGSSMTSADLDGDDDWDKGSKKKAKDSGYRDDDDEPVAKSKTRAQSVPQAKSSSNVKTSKAPQTEVDGWNLADSSGSPDADDEED